MSRLSDVAERILDYALQQGVSNVTAVSLITALNLERWQILHAFKELDDKNYGRYVVGRRGGFTRIEGLNVTKPKASEPRMSPKDDAKEQDASIYHILALRTGPESLTLKLPADISKEEGEKVVRWVKAVADLN